jgi:hypothetical protein
MSSSDTGDYILTHDSAHKAANVATQSLVDLMAAVVSVLLEHQELLRVPTMPGVVIARRTRNALLSLTDFVRSGHAVQLGRASMSATIVPIRKPEGMSLRRALSTHEPTPCRHLEGYQATLTI